MKKILILMMLFGLSYVMGYAQSGELYFSMTPQEVEQPQDETEGIYKSVDNVNDPLFKAPRYFFRLKSVTKGIHITFAHISVNPTEWYKSHYASWKDQMEITTTDNNIASYHTVYDLDAYLKAYSRDQLIVWLDSLGVEDDKKIYFFDKRDYSKGKITLIQVELLSYGGGY